MTVTRWETEGLASSLAAANDHTRRAYEHDVHEFVEWARRGALAPGDVDRRALRRYLAYLDTRGFSRASIARKAAALRAYFRYLRRHGVLTSDVGAALRTPKGASRLPRVVRSDEALDLIDRADPGDDDLADERGESPVDLDLAAHEDAHEAADEVAHAVA